MPSSKKRTRHWRAMFAAALLSALSVALITGCDRASTDEITLITDMLGVRDGMNVADVGAGDGVLLPYLAALVGPNGHVYATEIDRENLDRIQALATGSGLTQIVAVQGTPEATGLDANCCDAIVTRMVYHHLTNPDAFVESLHQSLKSGGRLLIIDFQPSLAMASSTPENLPEDRGGHGITPELVISEVTARGFRLDQRHDNWPGPGRFVLDHFALLFTATAS
ncbi:MAG: class I SAM-dependent methyltransferase [bacterium]